MNLLIVANLYLGLAALLLGLASCCFKFINQRVVVACLLWPLVLLVRCACCS